MEKNGPKNWTLISKSVPGRFGKSFRLRWCNQLSPQVEHRAFTSEEDDTIIRAHANFDLCFETPQQPLKRSSSVGPCTNFSFGTSMNLGILFGSDLSDSSLSGFAQRLVYRPLPKPITQTTKPAHTSQSLPLPPPPPLSMVDEPVPPPAPISAEFLSVPQDIIRKKVRSYVFGFEKNGLCMQTNSIKNAIIKCIGISKIDDSVITIGLFFGQTTVAAATQRNETEE
ncbi:hypothetical protein HAX54_033791 [Datura stramonium]|uniref:HTH myb-type domain-containing protein n=1 Tax=Datura stramonium TaxID=4076 RepID=A0ABS8VFZ2_DATST|nr:hypothetical protein [Datura stramonium]